MSHAVTFDTLAYRKDLKELETALKIEIYKSKADTIKWVAGMLVAQAAIIAALIKLAIK